MNNKTAIVFTFKNNERLIMGTLTGNLENIADYKKEDFPLKEPSKYDNIYIAIDGLEYKIL
ncbi:hypothetical protein M4L90_02785 [Staphylococcus equorum]|uniref:Uncharacterized protein n=1 Tax=Staphylococcus equorum TaxID=246432 RepID=A0A9X4L1R1_9STAP|nr:MULTISPECIES: hypothetical protein [Staphylococcus]MDG0818815.1 hypothetical protein [Staphylococcus equorum]MDG0839456.1 hypothetical protein [Staphylococcus equorum]MDG0844818.1 hypothetical protein [Staphylococcus equorum]